jgi:sorting and assembly machinery component 37
MLHLHVWGPAFGLPSIDPECLAAIAYLKAAFPLSPKQDDWVLIADHDPSASPSSKWVDRRQEPGWRR